jgi:hypothetical protein
VSERLGHASVVLILDTYSHVLPTMDTTSSTPRGLMSWQASNDTASAHLHMRKSRGTFGTPLTIVTGDILGRVVFGGFDGSAYNESAYIRGTSTGTRGSLRVPSKLEFFTSTDAAPSVPTVALTIGADQKSTFAQPIALNGSTSGTATISAPAIAGSATITLPNASSTLPIFSQQITYVGPTAARTVTLPDEAFTVVGLATTQTLTNKTYDTAGTGNSFSINGVAVTANTGTGAVARATSPTFVTPTLGAALATSITTSGGGADIKLGGTTSSFAGIKNNGSVLEARKADDSDYTVVAGAGLRTMNGATAVSALSPTGVLFGTSTPIVFSSTASAFGAADAGLKRIAANVAGSTNGSTGGGAFTVGDVVGSRPTCSVTIRGALWVTQATAGNGDILQVCIKGTADTYAWRDAFTAP